MKTYILKSPTFPRHVEVKVWLKFGVQISLFLSKMCFPNEKEKAKREKESIEILSTNHAKYHASLLHQRACAGSTSKPIKNNKNRVRNHFRRLGELRFVFVG